MKLIFNNKNLIYLTYKLKYINNLLKDFIIINLKDKLFEIIKFKIKVLNFLLLNIFLGVLGRLLALCLANKFVIFV